MNNQRHNNNNRRRGRGNRNQGGGNQGNRIDSRARGNAPQMLEKYKKLAQDAQHNGDRVQAEYYLQFADHYFRVLADSRTRQDEGRVARQREDRDDDGNEDGDFDDRQRSSSPNRRPRDRDDNRDDGSREDAGREDGPREDGRREGRGRENRRERADNSLEDDAKTEFEPPVNPFVRKADDEPRPARRGALKPRRSSAASAPGSEIDAAVLPPSLGARETANDSNEEDAAPKPRRRRRKPDEDGAVSAVG